MKNKIIFLVVIGILSCSTQDKEPDPGCLEVDFSGTANWKLVGESLYIEMFTGDFIGNLAGIMVATDSGITILATAAGKFIAPLGDEKFERTGYMSLQGLLNSEKVEYITTLHIIVGMEGFSDVTGYFYFDWRAEDEQIYYGGTFCFKEKNDGTQ